MYICKNCGKEFDESLGMRYCPYCACPMESKQEETHKILQKSKRGKEHKKIKKWFWIIIPLGIIVLLAGGYIVNDKIESDKRKEKERKEQLARKEKEELEARKVLAFATFSRIEPFGEHGASGLALVEFSEKVDGKTLRLYGFINEDYEEAIPCVYKRIEPFEGFQTVVQIGNNYGLLDKDGNLEQLKYTYIGAFTEDGFAKASKGNDEHWFINREGEELSPMYSGIDDPDNRWRTNGDYRLLEVCKNGKYGYVDKDLKEVIPCEYENFSIYQSSYFNRCNLILVEQDDKKGCYNWEGDVVIPIIYSSLWAAERMEDGYFLAKGSKGKWGVIDCTGETIISFVYNNYSTDACRDAVYAFLRDDGLWDNYNKYGKYVPYH